MYFPGGASPLVFRRLSPSGFTALYHLELGHASRFLEPLAAILAFARRIPACSLVGFGPAGTLAGFYAVHPDRRDAACWWLGWLAVDSRHCGTGLGRAALGSAMARLRLVAGCRRVRLLVAPDNAAALRLYRCAGFRVVGEWPGTGELVMECHGATLPGVGPADAVVVPALTLVLAMLVRLWRRGVPPGARMSGEFHGPPGRRLGVPPGLAVGTALPRSGP